MAGWLAGWLELGQARPGYATLYDITLPGFRCTRVFLDLVEVDYYRILAFGFSRRPSKYPGVEPTES